MPAAPTRGDRAVALAWLAHLVADAHQPCHAGSLYAERVFPEGDRGANSIPVKQGGNLHALWDGLLGRRFDEGDVNRRLAQIAGDGTLVRLGRSAVAGSRGLDPLLWLDESRQLGLKHVYTQEVVLPVVAASRGLTTEVRPVDLPEEYFKAAGDVARRRAAAAGFRLAAIWQEALAD